MTLYLRTEKGNTIVDIELWKAVDEDYKYVEISCSIDIEMYSHLLLYWFKLKGIEWQKLIRDFDELSEIRGWLHEKYFMSKKNSHSEFDNVLGIVTEWLKDLAKKYDLYFVVD